MPYDHKFVCSPFKPKQRLGACYNLLLDSMRHLHVRQFTRLWFWLEVKNTFCVNGYWKFPVVVHSHACGIVIYANCDQCFQCTALWRVQLYMNNCIVPVIGMYWYSALKLNVKWTKIMKRILGCLMFWYEKQNFSTMIFCTVYRCFKSMLLQYFQAYYPLRVYHKAECGDIFEGFSS